MDGDAGLLVRSRSANKVTETKLKLERNSSQPPPKEEVNIQQDLVKIKEENKEIVKPFLKRKTQAIKAKKISWQAKSKIDCWKEPNSHEFPQ